MNLSSSRRRRLTSSGLAVFAFVASLPLAQATVCTDICPGTGACSFNTTMSVDPGSVLDCSNRDITIEGLGNLKVTDGGFTLIARNLTVNGTSAASGTVTAVEGTNSIPGKLDIRLTGELYLAGKLRANGTERGGTISVHADGNITIPEVGTDGMEALGTSLTADGGEIYVDTDGALIVNDPILADGGGGSDAAGGSIELRAGGNITTDLDGHISAYGHGGGGGEIILVSKADVVLHEHLKAEGQSETSDGGNISVRADNALNVANDISVMGAVNQNGGQAVGGSVELSAGCGGISIDADILASGGQIATGDNGGIISMDSSGPIAVSAGAILDVHAMSTVGDGGAIDIDAEDLVTIANGATIDARGGASSPGTGGRIGVRACRVNLVSGSVVNAAGFYGGSIGVGSSSPPPPSGTQPLVVGSSAQLRAAGNSAGTPGAISVAPIRRKAGTCSNGPSCQLNSDCTVGCDTGTCAGANPDVAGVTTQFDVAPVLTDDAGLPSCSQACPQ